MTISEPLAPFGKRQKVYKTVNLNVVQIAGRRLAIGKGLGKGYINEAEFAPIICN